MQTSVYLFFNGNALEAMTRYADVLGGEVLGVFQNRHAPDAESRMPGGDDLVMNMAIRIADRVIMASDAAEGWYQKPQGFSVSIEPSSTAEAERVYAALSEDAQSVMMPLGETFWAELYAMFTDRYGTPWMINFPGRKAMV